ncbi:MAG: hypothetical protein M3271_00205 [Actinomycetota bacterium]|nr:hypothetical protein [Actinomycetota bacterium]
MICAVAVSAAGVWIAVRTDPRESAPPGATPRVAASPSGHDSRGNFQVETVRLSSRSQLVHEAAELGFDRVMVLTIGRPVRLEHYATDHLHLRMTYSTRRGEVRLFQSNDQGITSGPSVVVRGREGVRNGDGASWVERAYLLDLNPLKRHYVRALRWVRTSHPT